MGPFPQNPLDSADIYSPDDRQLLSVPVGCRHPYVRYVSRVPFSLSGSAPTVDLPDLIRFPILGLRKVTTQLWVAYDVNPTALVGTITQVRYEIVEYRDGASTVVVCGGRISPYYDQAVDQFETGAKQIGIRAAPCAAVNAILLYFSILVEP